MTCVAESEGRGFLAAERGLSAALVLAGSGAFGPRWAHVTSVTRAAVPIRVELGRSGLVAVRGSLAIEEARVPLPHRRTMAGMERAEIERRRNAALADIAHLVGSTDIQIRVIEAGHMLLIATIGDKSARPGVLQIIQRHFPDAAVKFEP